MIHGIRPEAGYKAAILRQSIMDMHRGAQMGKLRDPSRLIEVQAHLYEALLSQVGAIDALTSRLYATLKPWLGAAWLTRS